MFIRVSQILATYNSGAETYVQKQQFQDCIKPQVELLGLLIGSSTIEEMNIDQRDAVTKQTLMNFSKAFESSFVSLKYLNSKRMTENLFNLLHIFVKELCSNPLTDV